jgi:hypothetical protein
MYVSQAFPRARAAEDTPVFGIVIRPPRLEAAPEKPRATDAGREEGSART